MSDVVSTNGESSISNNPSSGGAKLDVSSSVRGGSFVPSPLRKYCDSMDQAVFVPVSKACRASNSSWWFRLSRQKWVEPSQDQVQLVCVSPCTGGAMLNAATR